MKQPDVREVPIPLEALSAWTLSNDHLRVMELYPCIQGEGIRVGTPMVMVRFPGCTVGCSFCDSRHTWKARQGEIFNPVDLGRLITEKFPDYREISLSGGETLEQPLVPLTDLILYLSQRHKSIILETSGTSSSPGFSVERFVSLLPSQNQDLLISMAPKLSTAKARLPMANLNDWFSAIQKTRIGLQLKFVYSSPDQLDEIAEVLQKVTVPVTRGLPVILQTESDIRSTKDLEDFRFFTLGDLQRGMERWVRDTDLRSKFPRWAQVRFMAQYHALVYGPKVREV